MIFILILISIHFHKTYFIPFTRFSKPFVHVRCYWLNIYLIFSVSSTCRETYISQPDKRLDSARTGAAEGIAADKAQYAAEA